ncbi:MAG: serine protease, partial [Clostridiales bacterium]|nr:serine protease [Clostridiales bacterium]
MTITEGNSGGALLDERGKLIGITTFRTKDNKGNTIYGL